jgi:hypothetical protein
MKRYLTTLALITTALLTVSSCTTSSTLPKTRAIGLQGQRVADAGLGVLDEMDGIKEEDRTQQMMINIVTSPAPDKIDPTKIKLADFDVSLEKRQDAYKALKKVYEKYYELANTDFGGKSKDATKGFLDSVNNLSKSAGGPADILSSSGINVASELASAAITGIQEKRLKLYNLALASLSETYSKLWVSDIVNWDKYIETVYGLHANSIMSLTADKFDDKKLLDKADLPFSAKNSGALFKLKLYNEAQGKAAHHKAQLRTVSKVFEELAKLHKQLAEQKVGLDDLKYTWDRLSDLIKAAEKGTKVSK